MEELTEENHITISEKNKNNKIYQKKDVPIFQDLHRPQFFLQVCEKRIFYFLSAKKMQKKTNNDSNIKNHELTTLVTNHKTPHKHSDEFSQPN